MLGRLLGSVNKERVLTYLCERGKGHASEIAAFFDVPLSPTQKAMERLEEAGVLVSRSVGRTREYEFNPRYAARDELEALVRKAVALYPFGLRERLRPGRTRPRRKGKPL